ncbi:MAG: hypothetical protein D6722_29230, partial [Bacteroidetes bacterium]
MSSLILILLLLACQAPAPSVQVMPHDAHLRYTGRFDTADPTSYAFAWTGSRVEGVFSGDSLSLYLKQEVGKPGPQGETRTAMFRLTLDEQDTVFAALPGRQAYRLPVQGPGPHRFRLLRLTEAETGLTHFQGLSLAPGGSLLPLPQQAKRRIVFFGNSITCGYGNLGA